MISFCFLDEQKGNPDAKDLVLLSDRLGRAEPQTQTFGAGLFLLLAPWHG